MNFPIITVVPNTMMNIKNGAIELFKIKSDHALIRVEFKKFIIYSLNILNGDDKLALNYTMSEFTNNDKDNLLMEGFYKGSKKEEVIKSLNNSLTNSYIANNEQRITNIGNKLKILSEEERKPVIFMFQELSLKSAKRMIQIFCNNDDKDISNIEAGRYYDSLKYKLILSLQDQVTFLTNEAPKDELRLTIIPNSFGLHNFDINHFESIRSFNTNLTYSQLKGYKSQLLTQISYRDKIYTLVNLHLNFQSTSDEFCDFIRQLIKKPNLIIIGDFNNNIRLRLEKIINDKFPDFKYGYKEPNDSTFIKEMPPSAIESERSAILDQVLYSLDDSELFGAIDSYHKKYLKYKNKYIHLKKIYKK